MLIFCIARRFKSHALSTKVTPHPIFKQIVELQSEFDGKYSRVRVMRAVAYVYPLNACPEPKD